MKTQHITRVTIEGPCVRKFGRASHPTAIRSEGRVEGVARARAEAGIVGTVDCGPDAVAVETNGSERSDPEG